MNKTKLANTLVNHRGPGSDSNDSANCNGIEWPAIPAEMLTTCALKEPVFTGIEHQLTFFTPRVARLEFARLMSNSINVSDAKLSRTLQTLQFELYRRAYEESTLVESQIGRFKRTA